MSLFPVQGYGCQDDTIFSGIFDGHGQWGHYVSKAVRDSLPPSLLRRWQEAVTLASLINGEKKLCDSQFDLWKHSYLAAAAAVAADSNAACAASSTSLNVSFEAALSPSGSSARGVACRRSSSSSSSSLFFLWPWPWPWWERRAGSSWW